MKLIDVIFEDFVNYKKPSMTLLFPKCTFKCGYELCQNRDLYNSEIKDIDMYEIIAQYVANPITESIVMQGLEPFDSFDDVYTFIAALRDMYECTDDVVIYTGYTPEESKQYINRLERFKNIIVKFGRYIPGQTGHKDELLGVTLCSNNQYAVKLS